MMPDSESVYDWMFNQEQMQWVDWMTTIPEYKCDPDKPFADIIVPTSDTIRYQFVMRRLLLAGHHVLAVGETGTGKTLAVQVCSPLPSRRHGQHPTLLAEISLAEIPHSKCLP
jgi:dynein heavy chain, axonemal